MVYPAPAHCKLQPLLECFEPRSLIVCFDENDNQLYDVLMAIDPVKPFHSLEVIINWSNITLLPARFLAHRLIISVNPWHLNKIAPQVVLSGASSVRDLVLSHVYIDVVTVALLDHLYLKHLELRDIFVDHNELPQVVSWLVSQRTLISLMLITYP